MHLGKHVTTSIVIALACSVQAGSITLEEAREAVIDSIKGQVASGADLNRQNSDGETRLHAAVAASHETAVTLLLDNGADVRLTNRLGQSALHIAATKGNAAFVKLLLDRGATVTARDADGQTPLHAAISKDNDAVIKLLLEKGTDANAKDRSGATPLLRATRIGHPSLVTLLKEHGANLEQPVPESALSAPAARKRELLLEIERLSGTVALTPEIKRRIDAQFFMVKEDTASRIPRYSGRESATTAALREKIKRDLEDLMLELLARRLPLEQLCLDVRREVYERNFTETELADLAALFATPAGSKQVFGSKFREEIEQAVADRFQASLTAVAALAAEEIKARYAGELAAAAEASAQESREATQRRERVGRIKGYLKTKPKDWQAWVNLGDLYYNGNQHQEAVEAYTRALALQPSDPDVLTDRGAMYHRLGETESAVRDFERAAAVDPKHTKSLYNLGAVLLQSTNTPAGARKAWEECLRRSPPPEMAARLQAALAKLK